MLKELMVFCDYAERQTNGQMCLLQPEKSVIMKFVCMLHLRKLFIHGMDALLRLVRES